MAFLEHTVDLSKMVSPPRSDESTTNSSSGWGRVIDKPTAFGNQQPGYWWLQCWRSLFFGLYIRRSSGSGGDFNWQGSRITGSTDILWTLVVQSSCDDQCGYISKTCICPYTGDGKTKYDLRVNTNHLDCLIFEIEKFQFDHIICPPEKPCEPDWSISPLPPECPAQAYTLRLRVRLPAGEKPSLQYTVNELFGQVEQIMTDTLKRAQDARYNMKCEGGPDIFPPPADE